MAQGIRMEGRVFGPLKVVCLWGHQTGNRVWIYWCRACGRHGHRQGVRLRREGESTSCPGCGRKGRRFKSLYPTQDPERVQAILDQVPERSKSAKRVRKKTKARTRRRADPRAELAEELEQALRGMVEDPSRQAEERATELLQRLDRERCLRWRCNCPTSDPKCARTCEIATPEEAAHGGA